LLIVGSPFVHNSLGLRLAHDWSAATVTSAAIGAGYSWHCEGIQKEDDGTENEQQAFHGCFLLCGVAK
jgi:hypothetical protein